MKNILLALTISLAYGTALATPARAEDKAPDAAQAEPSPSEAPKKSAPAKKKSEKKDSAKATKGSTAIIHTDAGDITVKLFAESAPKTVENFIGLAKGTKEWTDPTTGKKVTGKPLYN